MMNPTLLHTLDAQAVAVIGDIHGEIQALESLLEQLQSRPDTRDRLLVFIGDLCDRGPDSAGVIRKVRELVEQGRALAILGNHEINLLANDAKDGSGWFFNSREASDTQFYAPFSRASAQERPEIRDFLCQLPLAIRMPGLRIVHAAWDPASIDMIASIPRGHILEFIHEQQLRLVQAAQADDLYGRYLAELDRWGKQLEDPDDPPPYLDAVADYESLEQRLNPIKRLTSGIEARSPQPFFSGNRWRYSDRTPWWNEDPDPTPVLIGHYWRLSETPKPGTAWRYGHLFDGVGPTAWHGRHLQAFCIDYSVGARWRDRRTHTTVTKDRYHLAAMLWPERTLMFDDGTVIQTGSAASEH